jgi:hypothetical protein
VFDGRRKGINEGSRKAEKQNREAHCGYGSRHIIYQLNVATLLQMYGAILDIALAYGIGIVRAAEEILTTADEQNCRYPVIDAAKIGLCARGDASYVIP